MGYHIWDTGGGCGGDFEAGTGFEKKKSLKFELIAYLLVCVVKIEISYDISCKKADCHCSLGRADSLIYCEFNVQSKHNKNKFGAIEAALCQKGY